MNLVTIDDTITRLREHGVELEVVERVDRQMFYTAGSSVPLEHGDENIAWIRGQHFLDSDEVKAARAAIALGEKDPPWIRGPTGVTGPTGRTGPVGAVGIPQSYPQPAPLLELPELWRQHGTWTRRG